MITTIQRAHLRALGNALEPVMQIGKEGITDNSLEAVDGLLQARELIKIKVLKNCDMSAREVSEFLCKELGADGVQVIGGIIILYRYSTKKDFKHIELI